MCSSDLAKVCHFVLLGLLTAGLLGAAPAERRTWIPVGAPGGNVRDLAQDPRNPERIYLGTADGLLYRSDDGGRHWRRLSPGFLLRGCSLDNVVVDPHGTVLVGYWEVHGPGGGVARSIDGGQNFTVLDGIQGESVRALAFAPSDPRVLAAGTLTGVFLSKDSGRSWTRISRASYPDLRNIESLAFDPKDPRVIYAGTWHLAWRTQNSGSTWGMVHRGMIDDSDVMTLTIDPRNRRTLVATACTGIYRSDDGGLGWTKLRGIPYSSRRTRAFAQGVDDPSLLLAGTTEGLWVSENDGDSWVRTTPKDLVVNAVVAQPGGVVLLGTEGAGVLRSSDGGLSWTTSNTGFSEQFVFKLLFDTEGKRVIVAVWGSPHYGGVFVSPGVAGPWVRLGEGLDGREVLSLALLGSTIVAGADDGLYERGPDEPAWTRVRTRLEGQEVHPRVTELLGLPSGALLAVTSNGVIRSPDRGRTWARAMPPDADEVLDLAGSHENPDLVVAATRAGFIKSADGGETWHKVSGSLGVTPHTLAFVPSSDDVLFATTSGGLFRSRDQGSTWQRVGGGIPHSDLTGLAVSPDGGSIYASDFTWGGVFRSNDGGTTWSRMPTDGLGSDRVWTLGIDPRAPDRILAGASAGGLHLLSPAAARSQR